MNKSRDGLKTIAGGKSTVDAKSNTERIEHNVIINGIEMILSYDSINEDGKLTGATLVKVEK